MLKLSNPQLWRFKGTKLAQRTPDRVAHRRADLIRRREVVTVHEPVIEINDDGEVEVNSLCDVNPALMSKRLYTAIMVELNRVLHHC